MALAVAAPLADVPAGDRLMTPDAGGFRYLTGRPGIVTPEDPLPVVEDALRRYGIRWLILERDFSTRRAGARAGGRGPTRLAVGALITVTVPGRRRRPGPHARGGAVRRVPDPRRRPVRRMSGRGGRAACTSRVVRVAVWARPRADWWRSPSGSLTIAWVPFPPTEGSLYYLDVARNLVTGQGLVTDVLWSYARPPIGVPRPAFDLWLPLASFVAALPDAGRRHEPPGGPAGHGAAGRSSRRSPGLVAREAAHARRAWRPPPDRAAAVGAGVLAALLGPWLVATAGPDSTVPFAVLGTLGAAHRAAAARALGADGRRLAAAGLVLGPGPRPDLPRPPGGRLDRPDACCSWPSPPSGAWSGHGSARPCGSSARSSSAAWSWSCPGWSASS